MFSVDWFLWRKFPTKTFNYNAQCTLSDFLLLLHIIKLIYSLWSVDGCWKLYVADIISSNYYYCLTLDYRRITLGLAAIAQSATKNVL